MAEEAIDWRAGGFGLYLHWPFCTAKCPYCDFNSHVARTVDMDAWACAYESEIRRIARQTGPRRLDSVFFGGGTPSLMEPRVVFRVLNAAATAWTVHEGTEITLEANPTSMEARRLRGFRDAGVNRLSMGVQSLRDADLRRLGRTHGADEALAALGTARNLFARVSFDLIYARQHQSLSDWKLELDDAIQLEPDHLSLYQLTIEDGTVFGARHAAGRLPGLPTDDTAADMYALTQDACLAAGLPAYEISNHARPGCESRHNLIYWRSGDWAGIGPGAHARLTLDGTRHAIATERDPAGWLRAVAAGNGDHTVIAIPAPEQAEEYLMMGLRLREGVSLMRFEQLAGRSLCARRLSELIEAGLVSVSGHRLWATPDGALLLNEVLRQLLDQPITANG